MWQPCTFPTQLVVGLVWAADHTCPLPWLQTGPVLQAFYRFGPFDFDPEDLGSPAASAPNSPCSPPGPASTAGSGTAHGTAGGTADGGAHDAGEGSRGSSSAGASSSSAAAGAAGAGVGLGGRPRPLILLPGLGATMIAWGVPLLRALACSHEAGEETVWR